MKVEQDEDGEDGGRMKKAMEEGVGATKENEKKKRKVSSACSSCF